MKQTDYVWAKIETRLVQLKKLSIEVKVAGVTKYLPFSEILNVDVKNKGTMTIDGFREKYAFSSCFIDSIEISSWMADKHDLEIHDD